MRIHQVVRSGMVFAVILTSLIAGQGPACAAPRENPREKVFEGYLFGQPCQIDFRLHTPICHAFLVADGEGRVPKRGSVPSRELTAEAHTAGVRGILSLGGWGWDRQFAAIVSRPEAEDRSARAVMAIVDQTDSDGIDLDWEYPDTQEEVVGFERLTRRFRKELDELGRKKGRSMPLTMAASADPGTHFNVPTREQIIETLPRQEVVSAPDTKWKYSNLAIALAGELVAAASGEAYEG
jgi:chitinase